LFSVPTPASFSIRFVSFLGSKIQSYFALISTCITNAQIIMTCSSLIDLDCIEKSINFICEKQRRENTRKGMEEDGGRRGEGSYCMG